MPDPSSAGHQRAIIRPLLPSVYTVKPGQLVFDPSDDVDDGLPIPQDRGNKRREDLAHRRSGIARNLTRPVELAR